MKILSKTLIVIPVYNGENFIERTLDSCINLNYPVNIFVVDNQSTDRTQEIVNFYSKKNSQISLFVNKTNLGRVGNWNRCLDLFDKYSFDYIRFVFAGDEIFPDSIEAVEKIFDKYSSLGAVYHPYEFVDIQGKTTISRNCNKHKLFSKKELLQLNLYKGGILGAIIADTYSKKAIGSYRFNELFLGKSDFDFEILSNYNAYHLNNVLARFNLDSHNTFEKSLSFPTEIEFVYNRTFHLKKNYSMLDKKRIEKIEQKIFLDLTKASFLYFSFWFAFKFIVLFPFIYLKSLIYRLIKRNSLIKRKLFNIIYFFKWRI